MHAFVQARGSNYRRYPPQYGKRKYLKSSGNAALYVAFFDKAHRGVFHVHTLEQECPLLRGGSQFHG